MRFAIYSLLCLFFLSCEKDDLKTITNNQSDLEAISIENQRLDNALTNQTISTNLMVFVYDELGINLSGASVEVEGRAATTNSDGSVLIENVSLNRDMH